MAELYYQQYYQSNSSIMELDILYLVSKEKSFMCSLGMFIFSLPRVLTSKSSTLDAKSTDAHEVRAVSGQEA